LGLDLEEEVPIKSEFSFTIFEYSKQTRRKDCEVQEKITIGHNMDMNNRDSVYCFLSLSILQGATGRKSGEKDEEDGHRYCRR